MVMTDKESLTAIIKSAAYISLPSNTTEEHLNVFTNCLIAHGVTVQEWIPIKDRLPGEVRILTTDGNRIYLTHGGRIYRTKDRRYRIPENWGNGADVTHWMPLPHLPEKESDHAQLDSNQRPPAAGRNPGAVPGWTGLCI